ncbi:hypothetical protein [Burkholderia multivorans]|uniref:hypothetical protein n=1 Tax=Burkholderia multivorans TaxID=87883 RepID=UPI00209CFB44|nr:hypothetical protein [Burkholderia multivorans]MCO8625007.1 hypothetical protein [Burkholderia multivorans]
MNATTLVALISAFGSIAVAAITFFLTRSKDREAEARTQRVEHYREFLEALSGIVKASRKIAPENHLRWANACNTVALVASQRVLKALWDFQDATAKSNPDQSQQRHDECLNRLILAIRADLGISPKDDPAAFRFRLWSSD